MPKRVFIIHRWGGNSTSDWIPWLKSVLEEKDIMVFAPDMPDTDRPTIGAWVPFISSLVGAPDRDTYFVGHSVGCQTILRYVQGLPDGSAIGGATLVAPWINKLSGLSGGDAQIAKEWLGTEILFDRVKARSGKIIAVYSDNDPYVPAGQADIVRDALNSEIVVDQGKGHFTDDDDVTQLPSVLDALLKIMD